MENKGVLIGSIIFVFASFILMIVGLVYESYKSKQQRELVASIKTERQAVAVTAPRDFSMYKTIVGDEGREMVLIPEGPFTMGSVEGDPDEAPEHQLYLKSYYIDSKEVTQAEYDRFVRMTKRGKPFVPVFEDDISKIVKPELPAIGMSWNDAGAYCKWAGKRLPTEAEWEKAARGTDKRTYPWGNDDPTSQLANYSVDGKRAWQGMSTLSPVGSFDEGKSPHGIYDMAGNVWEWVADWYDREYYQKSPEKSPTGPKEGERRVIRGGSWNDPPVAIRTTARVSAEPEYRDRTLGVRCAMDVSREGKQTAGVQP